MELVDEAAMTGDAKYALVVGGKYNIPFMFEVDSNGNQIRGEVYDVSLRYCRDSTSLRALLLAFMLEEKLTSPAAPASLHGFT